MRSPLAFLALTSLVAPLASTLACDDEPLQVLAPKIEIGDPYDASFSVCGKGFIRECAFNYGDVPIGQGKFFSFMIKNPSPVDLAIMSIKIEQDGEELSFEGDVPTLIESELGTTGKMVTIKYIPRAVNALQNARIVIDSNAENLERSEKVVIEVAGTGVDLGRPELVVTPAACDFGHVGVGVTATCSLSLFNEGNRELQITGVAINNDQAGTVFAPQSIFFLPTFVPAGTGVSVTIAATPTAVLEQTGTFVITSNDPEKPTVNVPLTVHGAQAPTAIGRISRINGIANSDAAPQVEPLDDVRISADQSVPGNPGGSIVGWTWAIIEQPDESSVTLENTTAEETGFRFSSAAGNVPGLDVVGTFVVRLTVRDDTGATSTNDARVTINAIPTEGYHVQLTWDASVNDIDLHVARGNPTDWCSTDDCYYGNCVSTGLDWDGMGGTTSAGDPRQDIDDLSGYGPENTNIDNPINGQYTVGVDYFSGSASTYVTIKIFLGGALAWEGGAQMSTSSQFWEAARVDFNNGVPTVIPIQNLQQTWSCW